MPGLAWPGRCTRRGAGSIPARAQLVAVQQAESIAGKNEASGSRPGPAPRFRVLQATLRLSIRHARTAARLGGYREVSGCEAEGERQLDTSVAFMSPQHANMANSHESMGQIRSEAVWKSVGGVEAVMAVMLIHSDADRCTVGELVSGCRGRVFSEVCCRQEGLCRATVMHTLDRHKTFPLTSRQSRGTRRRVPSSTLRTRMPPAPNMPRFRHKRESRDVTRLHSPCSSSHSPCSSLTEYEDQGPSFSSKTSHCLQRNTIIRSDRSRIWNLKVFLCRVIRLVLVSMGGIGRIPKMLPSLSPTTTTADLVFFFI